ncbi:MAG: hypothetical protein WCH99_02465 [Verrucomicrobiota bacterium]
MNLQNLVVVVLRLMALDFFLRVAVQLTPQILMVFQTTSRSPLNDSRSAYAVPFLFIAAMIICAVLFWVFAVPVARFVTRGISHDLSFGALSLVDCYSIAFMAVGLFYISSHLPQVLNWGHYFLKTAASGHGDVETPYRGYDVSQAFIPFIVGVVLFVNGRKWAVALAHREAEGSAPATSANQE